MKTRKKQNMQQVDKLNTHKKKTKETAERPAAWFHSAETIKLVGRQQEGTKTE